MRRSSRSDKVPIAGDYLPRPAGFIRLGSQRFALRLKSPHPIHCHSLVHFLGRVSSPQERVAGLLARLEGLSSVEPEGNAILVAIN